MKKTAHVYNSYREQSLLSTMDDRDKKNVHQVCGSIDFAVLLNKMNDRD
jgi:hypothetical protein